MRGDLCAKQGLQKYILTNAWDGLFTARPAAQPEAWGGQHPPPLLSAATCHTHNQPPQTPPHQSSVHTGETWAGQSPALPGCSAAVVPPTHCSAGCQTQQQSARGVRLLPPPGQTQRCHCCCCCRCCCHWPHHCCCCCCCLVSAGPARWLPTICHKHTNTAGHGSSGVQMLVEHRNYSFRRLLLLLLLKVTPRGHCIKVELRSQLHCTHDQWQAHPAPAPAGPQTAASRRCCRCCCQQAGCPAQAVLLGWW